MVIRDFYNKHTSKLCFIAGASPSLRFVPFEKIQNHVTITVNSSILKYPNCDYFVTDDQGVLDWNYWYQKVMVGRCHKFLFREKLYNYTKNINDNKIVYFDHRYWQKTFDEQSMTVHENPDVPIIGARTSIGSAINIAVIMGCNPIVLLGMDNCFEDNKRYFWEFDGENKAYEINKPQMRYRFPSIKNNNSNTAVDRHCLEYEVYWNHFAQANPNLLNGRIMNCSVQSLLNVFPKVELDEVLSKFGEQHVQK